MSGSKYWMLSVLVCILIIIFLCPSGLVQWSSLVLVASVCPADGPCLSNHCFVPDLTQRSPGTPTPRP